MSKAWKFKFNHAAENIEPPQDPGGGCTRSLSARNPSGAPYPSTLATPSHNPRFDPKPLKPRKVRGGIKLVSATGRYPDSWPSQRWMRLIEQAAPGESLLEGLGYATEGQTRRLSINPGRIDGAVQGTSPAAYETSITLAPFTHDQSERIIAAMIDQAVYAAKLLAGELPPSIEDIFAPLNLKLFPTEPAELTPACNCRTRKMTSYATPRTYSPGGGPQNPRPPAPIAPPPVSTPVPPAPPEPPPSPWCKHVCCLSYLVAERFTTDPFLIFTLRGLPREELLERLRQRRAAASSGSGGALVYTPVVPGVSDREPAPLEESLSNFWDAGPGLAQLDMPIAKPEVSHPLLRRLGPSPFGGPGRFPLVGLLATCYDLISEAAMKATEDDQPPTTAHALESSENEPEAASDS